MSPKIGKTLRVALVPSLLAMLTSSCVLFDPLFPLDSGDDAGADAGQDAADASPNAGCEAGAEVAMACGNCGTMTMTCSPSGWALGPCLGEGVCAWGTEETCGTSGMRMCEADCTWGSCYASSAEP